jgi:succinylglutamic semialdehyde dehydrogenase
VVQSAFVTTGQRCSCARRLIVRQGREGDAIVDAVSALAERLTVGPWNGADEPYMGPLISARGAEAALAAAGKLVALGGKVVRPFEAASDLGPAFVRPGILDMTGVSGAPDEEIFAPVLQVRRVEDDFFKAVGEANNTRYGLSAGLITDTPARWDDFLANIRAGVVNLNRPTTGAAGDMPFGGLGSSGNHRPSAYYAADYCAYPVASFEAVAVKGVQGEMKGLRA